MISQKIFERIEENRSNINFMMQESIPRILNWIEKAERTDDKFDEYLSLFIATNMTYNLWGKIWRKKQPVMPKDKESFFALMKLLENNNLFTNLEKIELKNIFSRYYLTLKFSTYNKRLKKYDVKDAREELDNLPEEGYLGYIFNVLYVARCNLVHGEKGYESRQNEFLSFCSKIIKKLLKECLLKITTLCNDQSRENLRKIRLIN
jgi:hypothetical protein